MFRKLCSNSAERGINTQIDYEAQLCCRNSSSCCFLKVHVAPPGIASFTVCFLHSCWLKFWFARVFSPGVSSPGRNLKEWLQEQFCDKPLEQDDMRLHNAAYVGDLDTLRNLLQESEFKRWAGPRSHTPIRGVWAVSRWTISITRRRSLYFIWSHDILWIMSLQ